MSPTAVPRHIAIIMDGNGRWAQRRGHPRVYGHVRGSSRVKSIVREAGDLGVQVLTLYAFSTENWSRPEAELKTLWKLLKKYLEKEVDELDRENVRFRVIGEAERLEPSLRATVKAAEARLSKNTGLQLVFALSYGSRRELVRASRLFAEDVAAGRRQASEMSEALLESYLWTAELGDNSDVDFVIRTSGEQRISNFLLWQAAYAELYFTDKCWPDFSVDDFRRALSSYVGRERRFGGVDPLRTALGLAQVHSLSERANKV